MARRTDTSLATLLLVSRAVPSTERPLSASEFWKLVGAVNDPGVLLGQSEEQLEGSVGVTLAKRVCALVDRATALAFRIEELEQSGVQTLSAFDEGYPARWRERLNGGAPPAIHAVGAIDILDAGGLAIVGSRDVAQAGADVARSAAIFAARDGKVVISGGARGTDRLAMSAALESNGRVAGVLADSLLRTTGDPEVRRAVGDSQLCLVTPYAPEAPFNAGNAMGRNKLIYTLADVTFVVASDHDKGGTWSGATEAITKNYGRVAVWLGEGGGPGNKPLADLGAVPVTDIGELFEVSSSERRVGEQLGLGL
jgi:predicted Rossmann fold nucleotide-binding protein DprA/Smf involved in DNA uptake